LRAVAEDSWGLQGITRGHRLAWASTPNNCRHGMT
jgi:hypothetical protein